jgi:hypothetical protein
LIVVPRLSSDGTMNVIHRVYQNMDDLL